MQQLFAAIIAFFLFDSDVIAAETQFLPGIQLGTVQNASANEISGIAASRQNNNVLWGHNDSGDSARLFAMTLQGAHLGVYQLLGAGATDWEDMAIGPGPVAGQSYLYLGDIGDNNATRSSVTVYRVAEPAVSSTQSPANIYLSDVEAFTLIYPDGARDAETLMVDPLTQDIYIVSKRESLSRLYRAPCPQTPGETITMQYVAQLPWGWATGGDISADGDEILIRGYGRASLWHRNPGDELWEAFASPSIDVPLLSEPQGESIGFDAAGLGYFTISEGTKPPIYYFGRVPEPGMLMLLATSGFFAIFFQRRMARRHGAKSNE